MQTNLKPLTIGIMQGRLIPFLVCATTTVLNKNSFYPIRP